MKEIDDLKKRVSKLEWQNQELRGMILALLQADHNIIGMQPLMVSSRTAKNHAEFSRPGIWAPPAMQRGYARMTRMQRKFGERQHASLAPEVAEWNEKYGPEEDAPPP